MKWYLVKLVFQICTNQEGVNHQFDESLRLVQASCKEHAYNKAFVMGTMEQSKLDTCYQSQLEWRFIEVSEITEIGELNDGIEVHSLTTETNSPDTYIELLKRQALNQKIHLTSD